LTTCDSAGLQAQELIVSPVSESVQFKESSLEEELNVRDIKAQKVMDVLGKPGVNCILCRRL
jgi:hypothetical protein